MKILMFFVFILIFFFEAPGLIQKKYIRELISFLVLWSLAFVLSFLITYDVKIPSPSEGIARITKLIVKGLY